MTVIVEFDDVIGRLAGVSDDVQVEGKTVQDTLYQVARQFPSLRLFNCEGEMRSIVRVKRGSEMAVLSDTVADGDRLRLSAKS